MTSRGVLPFAAAAGAVVAVIALAYVAARDPVLALAAIPVTGVAALVLLRADLLLLVLVAALPWEDALAPPSAPLPVVKLLGFVLIASWALRAATGREPLRLPSSLLAVAALVFTVGVSFLVSPDQSASLVKTSSYVLFALFFFIVVQLVREPADVRRVLVVIGLSAAASSVRGLYLFFAQGAERAAGPISDPNGYAYVLAAVVPLVAYLALSERRLRWLWGVCFLLILGAVAATLSRGSVLGLVAVAVWLVATRRVTPRAAAVTGAVLVTVGAVVFALVAPSVSERVAQKQRIGGKNVSSRQAYWGGALAMAADRPLSGVGPARFGTEAQHYVKRNPVALRNPVVHNSYLEILAESGVFAILSFLAFLVTSWRLLVRAHRRAMQEGDRGAARLASALQAMLMVSVVSGSFISAQLTTPFWLIGALATVFVVTTEPVARPAALVRPSRPVRPLASAAS